MKRFLPLLKANWPRFAAAAGAFFAALQLNSDWRPAAVAAFAAAVNFKKTPVETPTP